MAKLRLSDGHEMLSSDPVKEVATPHPEDKTTWTKMLAAQVGDVKVFAIAIGYCLSASLLSIINKWAIMEFPYPGSLTALQYFTAAFGVLILGQLNILDHDPLNLRTMWNFLPAAICYYMSLFTNSELLLHANVDTFIVFRSAVPIFVAIGETIYLKQPWPSTKTWSALATILGGSILYVLTDSQFTINAYVWAFLYVASMSIDFVYVKHIVMTIGLNTWGLVLYNNLEALLLFPIELFVMGEGVQMRAQTSDSTLDWFSLKMWLPVFLSCVFGFAISFFGMSCRRAISATGFTVLGVVNKLLTVVINLVIWTKHASAAGTLGLLICIMGGVFYQQSTTKTKTVAEPAPAVAVDGDEEDGLLSKAKSPRQVS